MSKASKLSWSLLGIGAGVGCVIALIQGSGALLRGSIIALVVLGGLFFSLGAYGLGWFKAPFVIGVLPRTIILLMIIWVGMGYIGWQAWLARPSGELAKNEVAKAPKQETEATPERHERPQIAVYLQPGLSVESKDIRASGAVILIWNAGTSVLKNSDAILEMPSIKKTEYDRFDKEPERIRILAGQQVGARFVHLWAKELQPTEHHWINVTFEHKYEVGSLDEWHQKYHYGSEVVVFGQPVIGHAISTKDLAQ